VLDKTIDYLPPPKIASFAPKATNRGPFFFNAKKMTSFAFEISKYVKKIQLSLYCSENHAKAIPEFVATGPDQ
jgi:hypothetical protein